MRCWNRAAASCGCWIRPPASGVWREPQPLDLAREEAPLRGALAAALKGAGIDAAASPVPWLGGLLRGPRALLWGGTQEGDAALALRQSMGKARQEVVLEPGRSFLRLLDPATGRVLAAYEPARR